MSDEKKNTQPVGSVWAIPTTKERITVVAPDGSDHTVVGDGKTALVVLHAPGDFVADKYTVLAV